MKLLRKKIPAQPLKMRLSEMPFDKFTDWVFPDGYERQVFVHATGYAVFRRWPFGGHRWSTEYIWPDGSIG